MYVSEAALYRSLHEEHAEEASWLHDFCLSAVEDDDFGWQDAAEFEARREAHVDALRVGGPDAFAVTAERACDGPGERYVHAMLALDGCPDGGGLGPYWCERMGVCGALDAGSTLAVGRALAACTSPRERESLLDSAHRLGERGLATALVLSLQRTGRAVAPRTLRWLVEPAHAGADAPEASMLLVHDGADARRLDALHHDDPHVRARLLEALVRVGSTRERAAAFDAALRGPAILEAAAAGGPAYFDRVRELASSGEEPRALLALGVGGRTADARPILAAMHGELAAVAGTALYWLTGAALFEEEFVEERFADDELFDDEREAHRAGDAPRRPDGEPFGETVRRPSADPALWRAWLEANAGGFDPTRRYRLGRAVTASALVDILAAAETPQALRRVGALELRLRYGLAPAVDTDMPVSAQLEALRRLAPAADALREVDSGGWGLAGAPDGALGVVPG